MKNKTELYITEIKECDSNICGTVLNTTDEIKQKYLLNIYYDQTQVSGSNSYVPPNSII